MLTDSVGGQLTSAELPLATKPGPVGAGLALHLH